MPLKTLFILRHGEAAPDREAQSDHERKLTPRGEQAASLAGAQLMAWGKLPTLVLVSTAARALLTAELCAAAFDPPASLAPRSGLYLASAESYVEELAASAALHEVALVVGHNPGLEELVLFLTGRTERLATGALVEVSLPIAEWSGLLAGGRGAGRLIRTFPT